MKCFPILWSSRKGGGRFEFKINKNHPKRPFCSNALLLYKISENWLIDRKRKKRENSLWCATIPRSGRRLIVMWFNARTERTMKTADWEQRHVWFDSNHRWRLNSANKKQKLEKLPRLEWESIKLKLKVADAVKEFFLRKSNKTFFGNFHDGSFTANFGSGTKAAPRKPFRCLNFLDSVNDFPPKRPNTLARETWGQRWVYIVTTWLHSRVSSGHVGTQRVLSRETFKRRRLNLFICWCNFISQSNACLSLPNILREKRMWAGIHVEEFSA